MKMWLRSDGLWLVAILLAALATFEPALYNALILDDHPLVKNIPVPRDPASWSRAALAPWWPPPYQKNLWRPVTRLCILAQKALAGPSPWHFFAVNILLHGAVCLLLFTFARRLGWPALAAGLGALFFAVHPLHAEAVHQVVGRAELLAAFWMLCGLILYLRLGPGGWRGWLAQAGCFALALGSKEHALVYPCLVALLAWAVAGQGGAETLRGRLRALPWGLLVLLGVILALFFAGKAAVTGGVLEPPSSVPYVENPLSSLTFARRLPAVVGIFGFVASRLLWPLGLSPDYAACSFPFERGWAWGWSWAGVVAAGVALVLCARDARRGGRGWLLAAAALGSYVLTSNGPYTIGTVMAERLWYWPSAPACLGVGWLLARGYGRLAPARRRLGGLALGAVLLVLAGLARGNGLGWSSLENHAIATLARFPASWRGHTDYAAACAMAQRYEEGYAHAREAVRLMPRLAYGWGWLGANAMYLPGRQAEAEQAFVTALAIDPTLAIFDRQYGALLELEGRREEAARHLRE